MTTVLKAFNGDRAKNLEKLADEFEKYIDNQPDAIEARGYADIREYRRMKGYCEQLRIIAKELKK